MNYFLVGCFCFISCMIDAFYFLILLGMVLLYYVEKRLVFRGIRQKRMMRICVEDLWAREVNSFFFFVFCFEEKYRHPSLFILDKEQWVSAPQAANTSLYFSLLFLMLFSTGCPNLRLSIGSEKRSLTKILHQKEYN